LPELSSSPPPRTGEGRVGVNSLMVAPDIAKWYPSDMRTETQVAIIGAGPAGLMLSHLLAMAGIESVVLERHSRDYVEHRLRAGLLEQGTVDLLTASGLGERLQREALVHTGIEIMINGVRHR